MPIDLVSLPPTIIVVDISRWPDRDESYVLDHMRYYVSLLEAVPAVRVLIDDSGVVLYWGHVYLRVALELECPTIRAVVHPNSTAVGRAKLVSRSDVVTLDWSQMEAYERTNPVVGEWHVFFFDRPLSASEKRQFNMEVVAFVFRTGWEAQTSHQSANDYDVQYHDMEGRATFFAPTLVGNEFWYRDFARLFMNFSTRVVRIATYQGRRIGSK